ncbi:V-type proton ATPase subunit D-like [Schistocerca gregaria]|uniref:V-type proton ATPase subunit D-like n=1 Tax=Schistocerca gregaria TaxID=7010 RepID=UPI00211E11EF|nr:V-type proton ATPase subunit D-like [Schistocerca gregaria]
MSQDKIPCVPTRLALQNFKQKLVAATAGHLILKKKVDALTIKFHSILRIIVEKKSMLGEVMRDAYISLSAAKFAVSDSNFQYLVLENVEGTSYKLRYSTSDSDEIARLRTTIARVCVVQLPIFEPYKVTGLKKEYAGLGQGGGKIKACCESYSKVLKLVIEIATLQTLFLTLDQVIKSTNRRVNAIEHIIKPRLINTIASIQIELEEMEREEMFRLKKFQQNKEKEASRAVEAFEAATEDIVF